MLAAGCTRLPTEVEITGCTRLSAGRARSTGGARCTGCTGSARLRAGRQAGLRAGRRGRTERVRRRLTKRIRLSAGCTRLSAGRQRLRAERVRLRLLRSGRACNGDHTEKRERGQRGEPQLAGKDGFGRRLHRPSSARPLEGIAP
ncbi:Hypothetical protein A7982_10907 [Minicystis rosea]|nr:Hypothetical protein A7982_10907 [Minicystis rosea]